MRTRTGITLAGLKSINSPVVTRKAVGYNPITQSTVVLTNKVEVTVGAFD